MSRYTSYLVTQCIKARRFDPDTRAQLAYRFATLYRSLGWDQATVEQFIGVVDSYIRWYNERRIKISLGALSPIEYRESLGLAA